MGNGEEGRGGEDGKDPLRLLRSHLPRRPGGGEKMSIYGFDEVELAVFFLVFVAEFGLFVGEVD